MINGRALLALALLLAACSPSTVEEPGGPADPSKPPVDAGEEPRDPPATDTQLEDAIDPGAADARLLSLAVFEATNAARAGEGLGALQHCPECEVAAQQHADDMARLDFFSHENPDPALRTVGLRLQAAGLSGYAGWAENIANYPARTSGGMHTYRSFATYVLDGWMNSSGHRANILSTSMTHLGAACALDGTTTSPRLKCVQDFVRASSMTR
jgi:uncharacterized protein YkwD